MKALNQSNPKLSHEYRLATRSLLLTSRILNYCVGEFELPPEFQEEWQALVQEHNLESDHMHEAATHIAVYIEVGTKPNAADRKTMALAKAAHRKTMALKLKPSLAPRGATSATAATQKRSS